MSFFGDSGICGLVDVAMAVIMSTPPKTNIEPTNWWCVDVSPFPRGYFQVPCLFSGVYFK